MRLSLLVLFLLPWFSLSAELMTHLPDGFHGADNGNGEYLILQVSNNRITSLNGNVIMLCENSDPLEEPTYDRYFTITMDNFTSLRRGRKTFLKSSQRNDGENTTGSFANIQIAILSGLTASDVALRRHGQTALLSLTASEGTQNCGVSTVFNLIPGRTARKWLTADYGGAFAALMRVGPNVGYFTFAMPMSCVSEGGQYMDLVHVGGEWVRRNLRTDGTLNTYILEDLGDGTGTYTIRLARDGTVEITGDRVSSTGDSCNGIMVLQTVVR